VAGVLLLLANFGLLPRDFWRSAAYLWPIVLIIFGVELLVAKRVSWVGVVVALATLVLLAALAPATGFRPAPQTAAFGQGVAVAQGNTLVQPLDGAEVADIELSHGAGRLNVTSGAPQGVLAEAVTEDDAIYTRRYRVEGGVGSLDLSLDRGGGAGWLLRGERPAQRLDVRLSGGLPIRRLEVEAGAAEVDMALDGLTLQRLQLNAGASAAKVRLPSHGSVRADMSMGAGSLIVEVPNGMAARIRVDGGLAGVAIDEGRFPRVSVDGIPGLAARSEHRSADFDSASNRVDLRISAGVAGIDVR
jgi:hypothetical protein